MSKWLVPALAFAIAAIPATALANLVTVAPETGTGGISLDLGRNDFRTYCAACHGVGARGDGTVAEFLTIAAPDLTKLRKLNAGKFPRERVTELIDGRAEVKVHGPRDMPVWGDWFDLEAASADTDNAARDLIVRERIGALVNFIESIQEN